MWLNRYLASNGWLSRCRDTESPGQGAATLRISGRKQQQFLLCRSTALTPKPSYSLLDLLDPGRCFVPPLQYFPSREVCSPLLSCVSVQENINPEGLLGAGHAGPDCTAAIPIAINWGWGHMEVLSVFPGSV